MEPLGPSKRGHISGFLHHQPTHVIDIPAGRNSERYYIPLYNVPPGGVEGLRDCWPRDTAVEEWQFHNESNSGWVCLGSEKSFRRALEGLQEAKRLHPPLEYSAANRFESIKLEVVDRTSVEPTFIRLHFDPLGGPTRCGGEDQIDWIRNIPPDIHVTETQRILMAGLAYNPTMQELSSWICSKLGIDCLLAVSSRTIHAGSSRALALTLTCSLAMTDGMSIDKIGNLLDKQVFGYETVRILVERKSNNGAASQASRPSPPAPLVVLGSSRLPPQWPKMVSRWRHWQGGPGSNATWDEPKNVGQF